MSPVKALKLRISAHHLGRVGLLGIALATAIAVFFLALVVRLLLGPISLGPFDGGLRASLNHALPGLTVRFDDAALEWSWEEGRLNLVVLGARVFDENERIIAQAPEAEVGLSLVPFLEGRIEVRRIALVGVQLTLVHSRDGALSLGLDGGPSQSDVLDRIRNAIAHSGNGAASLEKFAVDKARLAFYEQETGAFIVAPNANLQITKGSGLPGDPRDAIKASVDANIEISGKPARLEAVLHLPGGGKPITGDVSVSGLELNSLAANTKFFSFLAPFALKTDVTGSFTLSHGTQLSAADFGIGAAGDVNDLGKPLHLRAVRITGRYDGITGRLLIDDASLDGIQVHAHLTGQGDLAFGNTGALSKATLTLDLDKLAVSMPNVMGRAVTAAHGVLRGVYTPSDQSFAIEQALLFGGPLSAKFLGRVQLANGQSPEIDIDGSVAQLSVRDLVRFWPLQVAEGARDWVDANVSAGRVGPVLVHTHLLPGALDAPALPENALSVTFPVTGGTITYIRGLTPLTNVSGTAVLSGDTFKADVDGAVVGPLGVSSGHVLIPNLHLHGAPGQVNAHVAGTIPQILALIDQKPLNYPSRFRIRTASARGSATVDLSVRIPMIHNISVGDVSLAIHANATDFGLALSDHLSMSNGNLNVDINNQSLHATGTSTLADSNFGIDWTEVFAPKGPISTRLKLNGQLQDSTLSALGIDATSYLTGGLGLDGELDGYRGRIDHAQLHLDLTPAQISVNLLGYRKPAGMAAQAQIGLHMDSGGNIHTADFVLSGTALSAHGSARLGPNGSLQALDVPSFHAGANDDFAVSMTRDPVQGMLVQLSGHSFDEEDVMRDDTSKTANEPPEKSQAAPEPYRINVRLDRLVMREGVVLAPFALNVNGVGHQPRALALNAMQSKTAQLTASLSNAEDGAHVKLVAGDAGLFLKGLLGSSSIKGGTLTLQAVMSGPSARSDPLSADYAGQFTITDVTAQNQPFLMRLFSAGSFDGLAALMGAKGIQIDSLDIPFTLHGDVFTVREARASATALGLTADGYYDLKTNNLDLQGTFTPFYGINGIVSSVPVLGRVLGSKKGEGLIGVTYGASGDADNPDVTVNPFSVLTPGILRRVFQGSPPHAQANSTSPQPVAPAQPQQ